MSNAPLLSGLQQLGIEIRRAQDAALFAKTLPLVVIERRPSWPWARGIGVLACAGAAAAVVIFAIVRPPSSDSVPAVANASARLQPLDAAIVATAGSISTQTIALPSSACAAAALADGSRYREGQG